ncbi:hypothetical protein [Labrys miyagiensis]|nr:hypothetical protein [Labrys miyagiensis]
MTNDLLAIFSTLLALGLCTVYATRTRELARVRVIARRSRRLPPRG